MSLLEVKDLSHRYGDKMLYKDAALELYKGEHMGMVGQNGAGKSTLINILIGDVIPDNGSVKWQSGVRIGHLDQYAVIDGDITVSQYLHSAFADLYAIQRKLDAVYKEIADTGDESQLRQAAIYQEQLESRDFYAIEGKINQVVLGLGIDAIGVERPLQKLSGGQRAKIILAKLLLEAPDVLLLDEPVNFLDKEHVDWLAEFLKSFSGAFIVISHDHAFLESVCTCICDIEFTTIKKYCGTYSDFQRQKQHLRKEYMRQYAAQQKMITRTEDYIRRNIAGIKSKNARGRRKQLDRMERIAPPNFQQKPSIKFRELPIAPQAALKVNNLEVGYNSALLPKLNFSVAGGKKLVITGFNGIGKSTLLKTLIDEIPAISGGFNFSPQAKVGYNAQELSWANPQMTPLQIVLHQYPDLTQKEIRRQLAQCGVKDDHVTQAISTLSGGEQTKVKLCLLLLTPFNFLILDEPTNHLDQEAKQALQTALAQFSGSVILVCHEESFYKSWADNALDIAECVKNPERMSS
ncbi:MAG: ABC-F family ATP-binding cassette domain-containing protein [Firmicutes bacterium]|nr:ABC-F family ATP-binding cassette domain-containing protein [Bacillota bacterium]